MIQCCLCTYYLGPMQFRSIARMHMNQYHGSLQRPDKSMQPCPSSLCPVCMCHLNVRPCLPLMEIGVSWLVCTHSWYPRINGVFLCNGFDVSGIKSWVQCFVVRRRSNVMNPYGDVGMWEWSILCMFSFQLIRLIGFPFMFQSTCKVIFPLEYTMKVTIKVFSFCLFLKVLNLSQFES